MPPEYHLTFMTVAVTVGPSLFQLLFVHPHYIENKKIAWEKLLKKKGPEVAGEFTLDSEFVVINVCYVFTCLFSLACLLIAAMTDPGIIPRKKESANHCPDNASSNNEFKKRYFISKTTLMEQAQRLKNGASLKELKDLQFSDANNDVDEEKGGADSETPPPLKMPRDEERIMVEEVDGAVGARNGGHVVNRSVIQKSIAGAAIEVQDSAVNVMSGTNQAIGINASLSIHDQEEENGANASPQNSISQQNRPQITG